MYFYFLKNRSRPRQKMLPPPLYTGDLRDMKVTKGVGVGLKNPQSITSGDHYLGMFENFHYWITFSCEMGVAANKGLGPGT